MALVFPSSPNLGDVYQSGSSATYQWNGSYWNISTGSTALVFDSTPSASYSYNSHRRDITKVGLVGYAGGYVIADNKMFVWKTVNINISADDDNFSKLGIGGSSLNVPVGLYVSPGMDKMYEIAFPNEAGTLTDAGMMASQAYALFDNGNLYMWGYGRRGAMGDGRNVSYNLPQLVATNVSEVYSHKSQDHRNCQYSHILIRKTDGYVYGTGYNNFGQLGYGASGNIVTSWTQLPGIGQNPLVVSPNSSYSAWTIAQKADGTVVAAGYNGYGQLGIGNTTQQNSFVTASGWLNGDSTMRIQKVLSGGGWADPGGSDFGDTIVWISNGTTDFLMCAGYNGYGILGSGSLSITYSTPRPMPLPSGIRIQDVVRVGPNAGMVYVLTTDGRLYGTGYNSAGELGLGNTSIVNTPTLIMSGALGMYDITPTTYYLGYYRKASPLIKKADGYYRAGYNGSGTYGALVGDGTSTDRSVFTKVRLPEYINIKLAGGYAPWNEWGTSMVVTDDNRIYAWGINYYKSVISGPDASSAEPELRAPMEIAAKALIR